MERQGFWKMNIAVETTHPALLLNAGKITLGIQSRKEMKEKDRLKENRKILTALCALINFGEGKVKVQSKNPDYSLVKHGIGEDLETSFKNISPPTPLDLNQDELNVFICVQSLSPDSSGGKPATFATNLFMRNGASSVEMSFDVAREFLEKMAGAGGRSPLARLEGKRPGDGLQEEVHVQELAAAFYKQSKLTKLEKFLFSESKNVECKSFETKKLLQRVKEILPRTVSAFANTDGGYLFIGLDEKKQIVGFEAKNCPPKRLESEIEKCIGQLPVTHFCEEKEKIKYTCKFIEVHDSGAVCSYVCALRVERFCCAVFAAEPESWHVKNNDGKRFTAEEWANQMIA